MGGLSTRQCGKCTTFVLANDRRTRIEKGEERGKGGGNGGREGEGDRGAHWFQAYGFL
jgi:hypothetical protein